jgi:hypothetical protein
MGDILRRSHPLGIAFLWRCARSGMWRERWARRIVARWWLRRVPIVRRRLEREPDAIMRAARVLMGNRHGHEREPPV